MKSYGFYILVVNANQGVCQTLRQSYFQETAMKWETPSAIDLRFGFEITMYIANR